MTIRKIKTTDIDSLIKMGGKLHDLHFKNCPDIFNDYNPYNYQYFEDLINDQNNITLIYQEKDKVIGFISTTIKHSAINPILKERKIAYIQDLYIDEKHQRKGIGKQLYLATKEIVQKLDVNSIELMVWDFNKNAIKFYQELGLTPKTFILQEKLK